MEDFKLLMVDVVFLNVILKLRYLESVGFQADVLVEFGNAFDCFVDVSFE